MKVLCKSCFLVWFLFCFPRHNYPTCSRGYHRMLTQIWHKQQKEIINQRISPRCNNPAMQTRGQWTKASNHGPNSIGSTLRSVFAPAVPSLAMAAHQNSEHFLWNTFFNTSLQYLRIFFNCGFFAFCFYTHLNTYIKFILVISQQINLNREVLEYYTSYIFLHPFQLW